MTDLQHTSLLNIAKHFESLEDPRCHINRKHPLDNVIVIAIMAILAGANGPTAIAHWAWEKRAFLAQALSLPPEGVPSKDVFRMVLSLLNPTLFQACFDNWVTSMKLKALDQLEIDRPILNIDGKSLRRSHDRAHHRDALHCVSIWASELGLSLKQIGCQEKSNEITAIPELLELVDISGSIITIDAMGCQKVIVQDIIDGEADYVIGLKGNQEKLQEAVMDHFDKLMENDFEEFAVHEHTVTEKCHGQKESRIYTQVPVTQDFPMLKEWAGLKSVGMATRYYVKDGKEHSEVRYFISSLSVDVQEFARAVRQHWGIENSCHWSLDMTFREDYSRIRGESIRENYAWLNRLALSLLKQHPSKYSIAMKRQICGWSEEYLLQVLLGITL